MFFCVSACQCEPINVEARRQSQLSLSTCHPLFFSSGTCQIRYASWTVSPGHLPISASPELRLEYTISVPVFCWLDFRGRLHNFNWASSPDYTYTSIWCQHTFYFSISYYKHKCQEGKIQDCKFKNTWLFFFTGRLFYD